MRRPDSPAMSERPTATTSKGERWVRLGSSQTTLSHLRDRDQDLVALGWKKGTARWLALVALHGGLFLRSQYAAFHGCSEATARRFVARLIAGNWARQFPIADERGGRSPLVCHLTARAIYRELDIEHTRYRRRTSEHNRWRRLLCFDYIIEHPTLNWLPTQQDKVEYFQETLGVDTVSLPRQAYTARSGPRTARYFPARLAIHTARHLVTFLYPCATGRDVIRWPYWVSSMDPLWAGIRAKGTAIHVVALCRTNGQVRDMRRTLDGLRAPVELAANDRDRRQLTTLAAIRDPEHWHDFGEHGPLAEYLETVNRVRRAAFVVHGTVPPIIEAGSTYLAGRLEPESITL